MITAFSQDEIRLNLLRQLKSFWNVTEEDEMLINTK